MVVLKYAFPLIFTNKTIHYNSQVPEDREQERYALGSPISRGSDQVIHKQIEPGPDGMCPQLLRGIVSA